MPWVAILQFVIKYKKWFIYGAVGLVIFWSIKIYGNHAWEQGVEAGSNKAQVEMAKQYAAKWAEAQKQIDNQRRLLDEQVKQNAADRELLSAREEELRLARRAIISTLERVVKAAEVGISAGYESASGVPDDQLDRAIRDLSGKLERERRAASPPNQ